MAVGATVHGVAKNWIQLSMHTLLIEYKKWWGEKFVFFCCIHHLRKYLAPIKFSGKRQCYGYNDENIKLLLT